MEKKMTKREMFMAIREVVANDTDMVEFIDHEIELLSRKHSTRKPTKTQIENEGIKEVILDALDGNTYTIRELCNSKVELSSLTSQKVSALVTQLKKANLVVRTEIKGIAYFTKA